MLYHLKLSLMLFFFGHRERCHDYERDDLQVRLFEWVSMRYVVIIPTYPALYQETASVKLFEKISNKVSQMLL